MKTRSQMVGEGFDGFDRSVAEKMPKIRKEEEPAPGRRPNLQEEDPQPVRETSQEMNPPPLQPDKPADKRAIFTPPGMEETDENLGVFRLIEDLHAQLLVANRTKRALEIDLLSFQKKIQQLAGEKKALSIQVEALKKQLQKSGEIESEVAYLEEENEDALLRIAALQREVRDLKEILAKTTQERDQAFRQVQALEATTEKNDLLRIKGRLKEREASHFLEENDQLRRRLEEVLTSNMDLERRYEALKKSFNEVKESLAFLRDSCKANYYDLSMGPNKFPKDALKEAVQGSPKESSMESPKKPPGERIGPS